MSRISTVTFTGQSGTEYQFEVWPRDTNFNDVGGIYIFSYRTSEGNHTVLYVGQTNSLKCQRLLGPKFRKVKTSFVVKIRQVSNTLMPNAGVFGDTPV
jgi:hypothetical protein